MNRHEWLENRGESIGLLGTSTAFGTGVFAVESGSTLTVSGDTVQLGQERETWMQYLTVQTLTHPFQSPLNQTNAYIDVLFSVDNIYGGYHSFAMIDKRGIKEFSFGRPQNLIVPKVDSLIIRKEKSTTSTENLAEARTISKVQRGSFSIVERLKSFATLRANWDSYDAKPIEWSTINRAIAFTCHVLYDIDSQNKDVVPCPFIAPRSDGGIQFEWTTCYKELIHSIPEKENELIEYLKVDSVSGEEKEEEGEVSSIDDIVDIVTEWLL